MDLAQLEQRLNNHDWTYAYSDDHRAYCSGRANHDAIKQAVEALGEPGKRLYNFHHANAWRRVAPLSYRYPYPDVDPPLPAGRNLRPPPSPGHDWEPSDDEPPHPMSSEPPCRFCGRSRRDHEGRA